MSVIKLSRPFSHKGVDVKELDLHLDALTGRDLVEIESQLSAAGKVITLADFSKLYQSRVAAKAAGIPVEVLENLPARDFNKIVSSVQAFLLKSDSSEEEEASPEPLPKEIPPAKS